MNITKEWFMERAALEGDHEIGVGAPCNCIGPQNGQPLCPCRMRGVEIENGRYVERRDLGPVPQGKTANSRIAGIRLAAKSLGRNR